MGEGRIPEISEDAGDKLTAPLAPFHVVGLQMASRSQLLYCDIAIIPANQEQPNPRTKKSRKKSFFDEWVGKVRRFLTSHKLSDVCTWAWHDQSPIRYLLNETDFQLVDKTLSTIISVTVLKYININSIFNIKF